MFQPRMAPEDGQGRSCMDTIRQYWNDIPFFNKSIIIISCVLYIPSFLTPGPGESPGFLFINIPNKTVRGLQIWRIFTATLTHLNFLQLLFCLISLIPDTIRLERLLGTVAFMFDFLVKAIEIQILYSIIMSLLSLASEDLGKYPSSGLWCIVMVYLTIRCATNPEDPTYLLCFPVVIKQKYYPIMILLIFSLFFQTFFDIMTAMIVGYIEYYFFNGMMIRISASRASQVENSFLLSNFKTRSDFLSCQNINSPYYSGNYGNFGRQNIESNESSQSNPNSGSVPAIQPFSGRGVQVGGGPLPSIPIVGPPIYSNRNEQAGTSQVSSSSSPSKGTREASSQGSAVSNNQGAGVFVGKGIFIGSGQTSQKTEDDILKPSGGEDGQKNTNNKYIKLQNEETEPSQKKNTAAPLNEDLI